MISKHYTKASRRPVEPEKPKPPIRIKNPGVAPEWKALPRRRCVNCGKRFQPARPEQRFCRDSMLGKPDHCRNQFKLHGGSFHRLLPIMQREVATAMAPALQAISELTERVNALEAAESNRKRKTTRTRSA